eukprot:2407789-Pyramimonas_sp.AAC.1
MGQGPTGVPLLSSMGPVIPGDCGLAPGMAGEAQPSSPAPCCSVERTSAPASTQWPRCGLGSEPGCAGARG